MIVNTVQSAAVIASDFEKRFGRGKVEHLSTALTADDQELLSREWKDVLK